MLAVSNNAIMAKQLTNKEYLQVEKHVIWIEALATRKKTTRQLGEKNERGEWKYCCLGVACRTLELKEVEFNDASDSNVTIGLDLKQDDGSFIKDVHVRIKKEVYTVESLVDANDKLFKDDKNFRNMRPFILLTIDKWLDNPRTAELLKRYFSTEIRTINKDMKAGKYDWKIVAAPENK